MKPTNALRRPALRLPLCLLLPMTIAGCAAFANDQPRAVTVKGNSFCDIAEKPSWSISDTKASISDARREAAKIDRLCKPKGRG